MKLQGPRRLSGFFMLTRLSANLEGITTYAGLDQALKAVVGVSRDQ
jgi:hypothetical protein